MWNLLAKLFGGGISTVINSAGGLVKIIRVPQRYSTVAVTTVTLPVKVGGKRPSRLRS
jgi:hypothetical protein